MNATEHPPFPGKTISDYYEEYKLHPEKERFSNGVSFHRIVCVLPYQINGHSYTLITIPITLLQNKQLPLTVISEAGDALTLKSSVYFNFRDEIPDWYFKTTTFLLKETARIGQFLAVPTPHV